MPLDRADDDVGDVIPLEDAQLLALVRAVVERADVVQAGGDGLRRALLVLVPVPAEDRRQAGRVGEARAVAAVRADARLGDDRRAADVGVEPLDRRVVVRETDLLAARVADRAVLHPAVAVQRRAEAGRLREALGQAERRGDDRVDERAEQQQRQESGDQRAQDERVEAAVEPLAQAAEGRDRPARRGVVEPGQRPDPAEREEGPALQVELEDGVHPLPVAALQVVRDEDQLGSEGHADRRDQQRERQLQPQLAPGQHPEGQQQDQQRHEEHRRRASGRHQFGLRALEEVAPLGDPGGQRGRPPSDQRAKDGQDAAGGGDRLERARRARVAQQQPHRQRDQDNSDEEAELVEVLRQWCRDARARQPARADYLEGAEEGQVQRQGCQPGQRRAADRDRQAPRDADRAVAPPEAAGVEEPRPGDEQIGRHVPGVRAGERAERQRQHSQVGGDSL